MDKEVQKLISKLFTLGLGGVIVIYAMSLGYDGYLAMIAVVALFGGEKALEKIISKGDVNGKEKIEEKEG